MQRSELERIYDEHGSCAFALFRRFTTCDSDAKDLLQDWLVKLARGLDSLKDIDNERAYLLKVAYRHAVDWSRRVGVRKRSVESFADENRDLPFLKPTVDADSEFLRQSLELALADLPTDQQVAVQLHLWEGLTFAEIGQVTGNSTNTAASRYRYGIEKLRAALQPIYNELKS